MNNLKTFRTIISLLVALGGAVILISSSPASVRGFNEDGNASKVELWRIGDSMPIIPIEDSRWQTILKPPDWNKRKEKAIILIHGWNPEAVQNRLAWAAEWRWLQKTLIERLSVVDPQLRWALFPCDWSKAAATGAAISPNGPVHAAISAANASVLGLDYARKLNVVCPNLRRVHFIAHSAGAWIALRAAAELTRLNPLVICQITFLDPFVPSKLPKLLGQNLDLSDTLVENTVENNSRIWNSQNIYVNDAPLSNDNFRTFAFTIATQGNFNWGFYHNNFQLDFPFGAANPYDYHSGPILFYADTIRALGGGAYIHADLSSVQNWQQRGAAQAIWEKEKTYFPEILDELPASRIAEASVGSSAQISVSTASNSSYLFQWYYINESGPGKTKTPVPAPLFGNNRILQIPVTEGYDRKLVCEVTSSSDSKRVTYSSMFNVKAAAIIQSSPSAPVLTSISPASVSADLPQSQLVTVYGRGFNSSTPVTTLKIKPLGGAVRVIGPNIVSPSELNFSMSFAGQPNSWSVTASNGGSDSAPITLGATSVVPVAVPKVLSRISIENLPSSLFEGQTAPNVRLRAFYSDGSEAQLNGVTASNWLVQYSALTFAPPSTFTAAQVEADRTATVTAFYTEGGVEKVAQSQITVMNNTSSGGVVTGEIIKNGSLANDGAFWTTNNADFRISSNFSWGGHTGGYAWLGTSTGASGNNLAGAISQVIDLPSNATSLTLSFSSAISLSNPNAPTVNDALTVAIRNEDDTGNVALLEINPVSHPTALGAWTTFTADLTPYKGTRKKLVFGGRTDSSNPATLRVDDVVVQVTSASPTLVDLAISGADSVKEGTQSHYQALANLSSGTSENVTASTIWSVNENASISEGTLTANQITGQKTARISASYVQGGITRFASKEVTILDSAPMPVELAIYGPTEVDENSGGSFSAVLKLSSGVYRDITGEAYWTFTGSGGQVDYIGRLYTNEVSADSVLTVKAEYSQDGVTVSGQAPLTIKDRLPPVLPTSIAILGPASVDEGGTGLFDAEVTFADGTKKFLTPVWGENSRITTITEHGVLICEEVLTDQNVTLSASYTLNSATVTATKVVTIMNIRNSSAKPEITMPAAVEVPADRALNLRLQTAHPIVSATAAGLPSGLTFNSATFEIQGTPTDIGTWEVSLTASNDFGTAAGILLLTVSEDAGPEWVKFTKADIVTGPFNRMAGDGEGGCYLYNLTTVAHRNAAGTIGANISLAGMAIYSLSGAPNGFAVTGRFDATFSVGGRTITKFPNGEGEAVVIVFNKTGQALWHDTARSTNRNVNAAAVVLNSDGSLFWGINYRAEVTFQSLSVGLPLLNSAAPNQFDCALIRINPNYTFGWGHRWGGNAQEDLLEISPTSSQGCRVKIGSYSTTLTREAMQFEGLFRTTWNLGSSAGAKYFVEFVGERIGYAEAQFESPSYDIFPTKIIADPLGSANYWIAGNYKNSASFKRFTNGNLSETASLAPAPNATNSGFLIQSGGAANRPSAVSSFNSLAQTPLSSNTLRIGHLAPGPDGSVMSAGTYSPSFESSGKTFLGNVLEYGQNPPVIRTFVAGHSADNQLRWVISAGGLNGGSPLGLENVGHGRWLLLCSSNGDTKFGRLPVIAEGGVILVQMELKQPSAELPMTFERWLSSGLSAGELAGVRSGSTTGDLNQNGQSDLLDYAFGASTAFDLPFSDPVSSILNGIDSSRHLSMTFDRALGRPDAKLSVEISDDLIVWVTGSVYVLGADVPDTVLTKEVSRVNMGAFERITVSDKRSASGARFMKLKATTGPAPVPGTVVQP